ncbi:MAG: HRDC domain-containing protein [Desulfofustis sp.]|nr:HRDC domain-containing protein [Desulfofustis sp.]
MITSVREFNTLIERACATDCVGLDTEFIWERTYYPKLGLIQLALSDEECFLIDPLAIDDLTPFGRLLTNPDVVKILHDAPQDLMILFRVTGVVPQNVFDTRIAAGFSGLSSTISLADLINILLEINLPKTETRTNWLNRPLNSLQIDYALDDVRYLRALRILLLARIIVPEIREWLDQEMKLLSLPKAYAPPADDLRYLRIKGSASLDRRSLAILRNLAGWREQEARTRNQPRGHIVSDKTLLTIARERTDSLATLTASNLLTGKKAQRYGDLITKAVRSGLALDDRDLPGTNRRIRLSSSEMSAYKQLLRYLDKVHQVQGVDPHIVGNNSEFKQLIKHHGKNSTRLPHKFTAGWRKELLERFF